MYSFNFCYKGKFEEVAYNMPEKSFPLIICDPPYFEIKGDFDFIYKDLNHYLEDVRKWIEACKYLLSDNGTLFWWGDKRNMAYCQVILDEYFKMENSLIWKKTDSMQYQYYSVETARSFTSHNERLLMYSNGNDEPINKILNDTYIKHQNPISHYLKSEFDRGGITQKEISKLFPSKTGGLTGCVSNWLSGSNVILESQYNKIKDYLKGGFLSKDYSELYSDYERLKKSYENKIYELEKQRRYFYNPLKLQEVLEFSQEGHETKKYDFPTKKPVKLCRCLISTTSRKTDSVLIPFSGSGSECEAAIIEGRNFISFDKDYKAVKMTNDRVKEAQKRPLELF